MSCLTPLNILPKLSTIYAFSQPDNKPPVLDTVDEQLTHQPTVEIRNRKPMRPNPLAPWELRIGALRAYYDVEDILEAKVYIRAVGIKERNRIRIAGVIFEL